MPQLMDIHDPQEFQKWLVPITRARRELGDLVSRARKSGKSIVVTKGGKPVAKVVPIKTPATKVAKSKEETKDWLSKYVGSWKGTYLDSDEFWAGILTKDSKPIVKL